MKTTRLLACLAALLATTGFAAPPPSYWDTNDATAGSGNAGGNWEDAKWTADPLGAGPTGSWTDGSIAIFSAGTDGTGSWTVDLNSTVSTPSIVFKDATGDNRKTVAGAGTIPIHGGLFN